MAPYQAQCSFHQENRTALGDADNRQGPDGDAVGMLNISDPLPGFCGRITDDPPDHTAARSPRSSEFRRLPGRASRVGSDGFCERPIPLLGRHASAVATRITTRSANHTGCPTAATASGLTYIVDRSPRTGGGRSRQSPGVPPGFHTPSAGRTRPPRPDQRPVMGDAQHYLYNPAL